MQDGDKIFKDKVILIIGGTGSLGKELVRRIIIGELGCPKKVIVFSRDEEKQYQMKLEWKNLAVATDEVYYGNLEEILDFRIGDIRDYESMTRSIKESDIVLNCAAMKHVPISEYFPTESIKTNILGTNNIIRTLMENQHHISYMISISSDKACKPVNVYGMCKAIQERLTVEANIQVPQTKFVCVRYGNVVASRGSIIPLFREQIKSGQDITITDINMTRFWLTLRQASDVVFDAIRDGHGGDTFIPDLDAFNIVDLANVMIGDRNIPLKVVGIRPGEKIHEILISEEEISRTIKRGQYYIIHPILPELRKCDKYEPVLTKEFTSANKVVGKNKLVELLRKEKLLDY